MQAAGLRACLGGSTLSACDRGGPGDLGVPSYVKVGHARHTALGVVSARYNGAAQHPHTHTYAVRADRPRAAPPARRCRRARAGWWPTTGCARCCLGATCQTSDQRHACAGAGLDRRPPVEFAPCSIQAPAGTPQATKSAALPFIPGRAQCFS